MASLKQQLAAAQSGGAGGAGGSSSEELEQQLHRLRSELTEAQHLIEHERQEHAMIIKEHEKV